MNTTITETLTLNALHCAACDCVFAITQELETRRRADGAVFCCPHGHHNHYGKSEADKLREQLAGKDTAISSLKIAIAAEQQNNLRIKAERDKAERKLKRNQRGVCTCCNRTFINLQRHMATKHPSETK